jgi:hypothetical protein
MKIKVIGPEGFGFSVGSKSVFPGEIVEIDEYMGRLFIRQGSAIEVKEEVAETPPPPHEESEQAEEKKRGKK